jgi:hypothetical protein
MGHKPQILDCGIVIMLAATVFSCTTPQAVHITSDRLARRAHVAVLTSGLIDRFVFTNFTSNFLIPMTRAGYSVDYYGSFGSYRYEGWNADTQAFKRDPLFDGLADEEILLEVNKAISSNGGNVRVLNVSTGNFSAKDEAFVTKARMFNQLASPDQARNTRKGVIRHWRALDDLWLAMQQVEIEMGIRYTYIVYQKDDFLWLHPFQFDKVLEATPIMNIGAKAMSSAPRKNLYTHMCQNEFSSWINPYGKHVIESLMIFDRAAAHDILGAVCNQLTSIPTAGSIEKLLAQMAKAKSTNVHMLPAKTIPGQRVGFLLDGNDGGKKVCLHKLCNSRDAATGLMDVGGLEKCHQSNSPK